LNNLKHRSTLYAVINDKADAEGFDFTKDFLNKVSYITRTPQNIFFESIFTISKH
jgi:hypothetical protein